MPKWKPSYESNRKYNIQWEKAFVWLTKSTHGSAYCKLCRCTIVLKLSNLTNHKATEKHKRNMPSVSQKKLFVIKTSTKFDDKVKIAELQIAVSMSCHSAICTVDHLSEIMVAHGSGSTLGQIKLHRTKCMALIKNVVSPELKSDLIKDLQNKKFTLIIDESTNVSTQKYLCILVGYLSDKTNQITISFLSLIPVQEATGDNIFSLIKMEIESCNQDLKNCIGFASDGASNMVGCNNSVWSRIRDVSPSCVQYRCVCHSLALCIKYAVSKLPSSIGFLLTEIPNWFRHSNLRREAFKHLFKIMNSATEFQSAKIAPLPFEKTSSTRWLVRRKVTFISW